MQQIIKGEVTIMRGPTEKWQASCLLSGGNPFGLAGFGAGYAHPYEVDKWPLYDTPKEAIDALCEWLKKNIIKLLPGFMEGKNEKKEGSITITNEDGSWTISKSKELNEKREDKIREIAMILDAWKLNFHAANYKQLKQIAETILGTIS